jgi:hypothetical protein
VTLKTVKTRQLSIFAKTQRQNLALESFGKLPKKVTLTWFVSLLEKDNVLMSKLRI